MGHLAIAWLLARDEVSSVIAGVSTPEQLADNVAAAEWRLDAETLVAIEEIVGPGGGALSPERPPSAGPRRAVAAATAP